jgi:hypothetical protein
MIVYAELERMWMEVVALYFKEIFHHLPGGAEESREIPQSKLPISVSSECEAATTSTRRATFD